MRNRGRHRFLEMSIGRLPRKFIGSSLIFWGTCRLLAEGLASGVGFRAGYFSIIVGFSKNLVSRAVLSLTFWVGRPSTPWRARLGARWAPWSL